MTEFNRGATVTPDIGYDPATGEEVISYDNANIAWASERNETLLEFDRHQDELLNINEFNGEIEHEMENTHSEDFLQGAELPPHDLEQLKGIVGDDDQYQDLMRWAAENLSNEFIDQFDAVMMSNDYPAMEEAIANLYNYYLENWTAEDAEYEEQEEPSDRSQEEADMEFNEAILTEIPDYQDMIQWASQNLPQNLIDIYDEAMDSTDHEYKLSVIQGLYNDYQNAN